MSPVQERVDQSDEYSPKKVYYDPTDDRIRQYRNWRRGVGNGLYACDFDQVEFAFVEDLVVPVALIEVTKCDTVLEADTLLERIWRRTDPNGDGRSHLQTSAMCFMAHALGIPAWVVVHQHNGNRFAVRRIDIEDPCWHKLSEANYIEMLRRFRA